VVRSRTRARISAADVVVTPGCQAAIDSIFRSFTRPGECILMEEPSYPGAIAAANVAGLMIVPIPTDEHGMRTDLLSAAAERTGAQLVFVQPRFSNPTGSVMSLERRAELLAIARQRGLFIIEDDWVRDLDIDGSSPPPLVTDDHDGHVIYLRSLSKVTAPGMRIGAVVARGPAAARLRAMRVITDFFASPLLQMTVAGLFEDPRWQRHLQELRGSLRQRRDTLARALTKHAPGLSFNAPGGGVVLWARLPGGVGEAAMVSACRDRGVAVGPGRTYLTSEPSAGFLRVSFAAAGEPDLVEAATRIGAALRSITTL
jgi:DNA-binding transcriptional MocR family regulator